MQKLNNKSRNAYNAKADHYDDTRDGKFTARFKELLLANMDIHPGAAVLDVACGNGSLLSEINRRQRINGYGIDISDQMVKFASRNNPDMAFHTAGCEAIPFEDASMDIVTVCAAYHHFPDTNAFAQEAARVLKPGGYLYLAEIYLPPMLRVIINPFVPLSSEGDVRFYSSQEIIGTFGHGYFAHVQTVVQGHIQMIILQRT